VKFCLALSLVLAAFAPLSQAEIVYDNFGPDNSFNPISPAVFGSLGPIHLWQAAAFTPVHNDAVTEVDVAAGPVFLSNQFTVFLMSDNGGVPGTILDSITVHHPAPYSATTVADVTGWNTAADLLLGGDQYWIALASPGFINDWGLNSTGATGPVAVGNPTIWVPGGPVTNEAFEVQGVPEPTSLSLLALGGAALIYRKLRARKA
jgi:hypothetical protein